MELDVSINRLMPGRSESQNLSDGIQKGEESEISEQEKNPNMLTEKQQSETKIIHDSAN